MNLGKILNDCFTGPDGKTVAIGRVLAVPALFYGLSLPLVQILKGQAMNWADFGVMFVSICTGVMLLVTGTNPTEPKG